MSQRSVATDSSESPSESSDNLYGIFLHVVEGIGLHNRDRGDYSKREPDRILLSVSLNNVKFEIEGHSTERATIFNSNCIWECSLDDVKRMKTDHRPVRIECFIDTGTSNNPLRKLIGTLLLPIRGLPTVNTLRNYQPKFLWHKLGAVASEWRSCKPEIFLLLVVAKKSLVDDESFDNLLGKKGTLGASNQVTETSQMLQSQSNVYVQLLDRLGLIQVGNNPDVDCDIFEVTITLRNIRNVKKLFELESQDDVTMFGFQYELLGSVAHNEIIVNPTDCYALNERITLKFKASSHSLYQYFQRIFYIPMNIHLNGFVVANYRFDCIKFFPDVFYFRSNKIWIKTGTFFFDRLHKMLSPRDAKPSVDYDFHVQYMGSYASKDNISLSGSYASCRFDRGAAGDSKSCASLNVCKNTRSLSDGKKTFSRTHSEPVFFVDSVRFNGKDGSTSERALASKSIPLRSNTKRTQSTVCVGTEDLPQKSKTLNNRSDACIGTDDTPISTALSPNDHEAETIKIIKELEAWKTQQMDDFITKLERKEVIYLKRLENDWKKRQVDIEKQLAAKITECEKLKNESDELKFELKMQKEQMTLTSKRATVDRDCEQKVHDLECDVQRLKTELKQRDKSMVASGDEQQNTLELQKLVKENATLRKAKVQLEQQLDALEKTHFSAEQLKEMMDDLRQQTARFAEVEKQRNYYKDQCARNTSELHKLKISLLKQQEKSLIKNNKTDISSVEVSLDDSHGEECTPKKPAKRIGKKASFIPRAKKETNLLQLETTCDTTTEEF